jgi:hypothetical protein
MAGVLELTRATVRAGNTDLLTQWGPLTSWLPAVAAVAAHDLDDIHAPAVLHAVIATRSGGILTDAHELAAHLLASGLTVAELLSLVSRLDPWAAPGDVVALIHGVMHR